MCFSISCSSLLLAYLTSSLSYHKLTTLPFQHLPPPFILPYLSCHDNFLPMQIKSLPFRMEQRSEHLGSTRGQNKKREVVNVRRFTRTKLYSNLPTDRISAACLHLWKAQTSLTHTSTYPIPMQSLSLALTGEDRLPSQTPTIACKLLEI